MSRSSTGPTTASTDRTVADAGEPWSGCYHCRDLTERDAAPPMPCICCREEIAYYSCAPGYCRRCAHDPKWVPLAEAERVADELAGSPVDSPTSRAYAQKRIADAIREVDPFTRERAVTDIEFAAEALVAGGRIEPHEWDLLAALAAAAHNDVIADALAQVRQVVVIERPR